MNKYKFGRNSNKVLSTCNYKLVLIAKKALSYGIMDASAIQGRRSKEEQNKYYRNNKSKVKWPNSKHNVLEPNDLSNALDITPYVNGKISWNWKHCLVWAGLMLAASAELNIKLRWGGNWDMDGEPITDQHFQDLVHFELR